MVMDQVPQSFPLSVAVDASAPEENVYSDIPDIFAKVSSDIGMEINLKLYNAKKANFSEFIRELCCLRTITLQTILKI